MERFLSDSNYVATFGRVHQLRLRIETKLLSKRMSKEERHETFRDPVSMEELVPSTDTEWHFQARLDPFHRTTHERKTEAVHGNPLSLLVRRMRSCLCRENRTRKAFLRAFVRCEGKKRRRHKVGRTISEDRSARIPCLPLHHMQPSSKIDHARSRSRDLCLGIRKTSCSSCFGIQRFVSPLLHLPFPPRGVHSLHVRESTPRVPFFFLRAWDNGAHTHRSTDRNETHRTTRRARYIITSSSRIDRSWKRRGRNSSHASFLSILGTVFFALRFVLVSPIHVGSWKIWWKRTKAW